MRRAAVLVREGPHYRIDAFRAGLVRLGYAIGQPEKSPDAGDLLLIWNRYGEGDRWARIYEAAGATVVVAENGYLGRDWRDGIWYALALDWNAGAGHWPVGGPERAAMFDADLKPWRRPGHYTVVLAQRGIGSPPVSQPPGWHQRVAHELGHRGHQPVIRGHPGKDQDNGNLYAQLDRAACAVTWASGAAVKALIYGVPVYHGLPNWIGAPAARPYGKALAEPFRGDRGEFLTRLAWAMWTVEEIGSGYAFDHLLRGPQEAVQPGHLRGVC